VEIEKLASILACIGVAIIILAGLTLIITAIRDERHARREKHAERNQAEADAHLRTLATRQADAEAFDLISKGKGGAI
jgi:ABC-type nickel/cobalt efflux system permease component RcnA